VLENTVQTAAKPSRRPRLTAPHKLTRRGATRRFNGIVLKLTNELLSARSQITTFEREMVRQAAALTLRAEQLQAAVIAGDPVDHDELIRTSSEMRRALKALNLPAERGPERGGLTPLKWSIK
jgi:hypothetical protein